MFNMDFFDALRIYVVAILIILLIIILWRPRWFQNALKAYGLQAGFINNPIDIKYQKDIASGLAVIVESTQKKIPLREFWMRFFLVAIMVLTFLLMHGFFGFRRCNMYGHSSGVMVMDVLNFSVLWFYIFDAFQDQYFALRHARVDGYFPSRKILKNKPFVAYRMTPKISKKQTNRLLGFGLLMIASLMMFIIYTYTSEPFQGNKSWHEANVLMQKQCLAKQRTNL